MSPDDALALDDAVGGGEGRGFRFPKFSLIFAPGVSVILFWIRKDLGEVAGLNNKNCLDAKKVILYSKNAKISQKSRFYIIK